ncbi:reverse transcriptase domain-containing protein [Tanacetum coccineum]
MLERLCGNEYYCFLDGFSGFFQIPIASKDQEKTTFIYPFGNFAYRRIPFGLCNAPASFQRCMTAIFHDMVEDFMEVFMDEFSNVPFELMCDASDFAVGAVLGQRIDGKFKLIYYANKTLNNAQEHYTTTEKEVLVVVFSFDKFHQYLILSKTVVYTDQYLFNKKDAKPRLIRLKNLDLGTFTEEEIIDEFPNEQLMILNVELNNDEPWYTDYVNYIVRKILCSDNVMRRCVAGNEILEILGHCHSGPTEGHHSASITGRKVYESGFYWPSMFKDAKDYVMRYDACQRSGNISSRIAVDYVSKWVEDQALPTNDARVVIRFLRRLFARFGVPKALISDRGTHFCNSQLEKALQKYGVTHNLSTAYYPQTNGQTEVTNKAIKHILERSVRYNPKNWSEKLDDASWAFRTAYKTPTGCTPFRLFYGKDFHLPVESKHKAYWALKQCNMMSHLA